MQKYILGKSIEDDKANSIKDLKDVGKIVWKFISSLYEVHWDSLVVDNTNILFRNKVKSKFSPQVFKAPQNGKGKNVINSVFISSIPSLILAKSSKKVNEILKFFKKNPIIQQKKLYTQASFNNNVLNIVRETLKIKKTFLSL